MTRRSYRRRRRNALANRAPRKGTVIVASTLYVVGLFGVLGLLVLSLLGGVLIYQGALLIGVGV